MPHPLPSGGTSVFNRGDTLHLLLRRKGRKQRTPRRHPRGESAQDMCLLTTERSSMAGTTQVILLKTVPAVDYGCYGRVQDASLTLRGEGVKREPSLPLDLF